MEAELDDDDDDDNGAEVEEDDEVERDKSSLSSRGRLRCAEDPDSSLLYFSDGSSSGP